MLPNFNDYPNRYLYRYLDSTPPLAQQCNSDIILADSYDKDMTGKVIGAYLNTNFHSIPHDNPAPYPFLCLTRAYPLPNRCVTILITLIPNIRLR